jgi:hypothetical protein
MFPKFVFQEKRRREKAEADPRVEEDRERMYKALGMMSAGDSEGVSSARLSALLKRARVFKILEEEAEAAVMAAAAETGNDVDPEVAAAADFGFSEDDPRLIDIW